MRALTARGHAYKLVAAGSHSPLAECLSLRHATDSGTAYMTCCLTAGGQACKLVAAGTYKPSLQLLMLQPGNPFQPMSQIPLFHPAASGDIAPLLHHMLPSSASISPRRAVTSPARGLTSPSALWDTAEPDHLPEQVVPESVQILIPASGNADLQASCFLDFLSKEGECCRLIHLLPMLLDVSSHFGSSLFPVSKGMSGSNG